jgi:hypothetical protein
MALNGTGIPHEVRPAATDFTTPLYNIEQRHIKPATAMDMETIGIDPDDYITLPERFISKYDSDPIGTNITIESETTGTIPVISVPAETTEDTVIKSKDWQPVTLDTVNRTYIEEYEVIE